MVGDDPFYSNAELRVAYLDEMAIWDQDMTASVSEIYNGGTLHDLAQVSTPPVLYWRMGDGDTHPYIKDVMEPEGNSIYSLTMNNMNQGSFDSEVPN